MKFKLISLACLTFGQVSLSAYSNINPYYYDHIKSNEYAGEKNPIYRSKNTGKADQDGLTYGDKIIITSLKSSHKMAYKQYIKGKAYPDYLAYNAFLVTGLLTPFHESLFIHIREQEKNSSIANCKKEFDKYSLGKLIKSKSTFKNFKNIFTNDLSSSQLESITSPLRNMRSQEPYFSSCANIHNNENPDNYLQLRADLHVGSDFGVGQVNVRWHMDSYFKKYDFTSMTQALSYSTGYIFKRYKKVASSYLANQQSGKNLNKNLSCFNFKGKKTTMTLPISKLIKNNSSNAQNSENKNKPYEFKLHHLFALSSWAAYNGGPAQTCRFVKEFKNQSKRVNSLDKDKKQVPLLTGHGNDYGLRQGFVKLMSFPETKELPHVKYKVQKEVARVLSELIQSVRNAEDEPVNLSYILDY